MSFKKELKKLLIKYRATISFDCSECSDLHGISGERIIAELGEKEIHLSDGYYVSPLDLEEK